MCYNIERTGGLLWKRSWRPDISIAACNSGEALYRVLNRLGHIEHCPLWTFSSWNTSLVRYIRIPVCVCTKRSIFVNLKFVTFKYFMIVGKYMSGIISNKICSVTSFEASIDPGYFGSPIQRATVPLRRLLVHCTFSVHVILCNMFNPACGKQQWRCCLPQ